MAVQTDPTARLAHLSLGAFLELSAIAAPDAGYSARVDPFPEGVDSPESLGSHPVAMVTLDPGSGSAPATAATTNGSKAEYEEGRETDLTGYEAYQIYGRAVVELLPDYAARWSLGAT